MFGYCTTGYTSFAECQAKLQKHSAKHLPSVTLGKGCNGKELFAECQTSGTRQRLCRVQKNTRQTFFQKKVPPPPPPQQSFFFIFFFSFPRKMIFGPLPSVLDLGTRQSFFYFFSSPSFPKKSFLSFAECKKRKHSANPLFAECFF